MPLSKTDHPQIFVTGFSSTPVFSNIVREPTEECGWLQKFQAIPLRRIQCLVRITSCWELPCSSLPFGTALPSMADFDHTWEFSPEAQKRCPCVQILPSVVAWYLLLSSLQFWLRLHASAPHPCGKDHFHTDVQIFHAASASVPRWNFWCVIPDFQ